MTDSYDGGNGDYSSYNDDDDYNKRKGAGAHNGDMTNHSHDHHGSMGVVAGGDGAQLNEKANEYVRDCLTEKSRMERKYPIAEKLLDTEIEKVQTTGRIPSREQKYADIYREKPLRVSQKVLVPIREHPKFNFVGKLLGPKGNSLRRLQEETLCKMTVLGRNSMRDRAKEEELRNCKDPKYAHLNSDLHVEISTIAPPAEAYARIAYAMAELRKYLIPDSNDVIRQEQLRELMDNTGISESGEGGGKSSFKKLSQQGVAGSAGGLSNMGISGGGNPSSAGVGGSKNISHHGYRPSQQTAFGGKNPPPKQKVLSILEKARTAMDETYGRGYEEHVSYDQQPYENYGHAHQHVPQGSGMGGARGPYETAEYEADYNRRDFYQHSPGYGGSVNTQTNQSAGLNPNHNRSHVNR